MKTLNAEFQTLLALICESISIFKDYDTQKIALSIGTSKNQGKIGIWAYVVPLRYIGGKALRKGRFYGRMGFHYYDCEAILKKNPEAHYLMTIMVPRFFRLSFKERYETLVHELYHLHPLMRGDLRRFPKPHIHHGPTPKAYQRRVEELTKESQVNFPELKRHPLLTESQEVWKDRKKYRLALPKKKFRFKELSLFKNLFPVFIFFLMVMQPCFSQTIAERFKLQEKQDEIRKLNEIAEKKKAIQRKKQKKLKKEKKRLERLAKKEQKRKELLAKKIKNKEERVKKKKEFAKKLKANKKLKEQVKKNSQLKDSWEDYEYVVSTNEGMILSKPKVDATIKDFYKSGEKFEYLGEMKNGYALVGDDDFEGWVEASLFRSSNSKSVESLVDEKLNFQQATKEVEGELTQAFDFVASKDTRLYETPDENSAQTTIVKKADELFLVEKSEDGKWYHIELEITGEKGWLPVSHIKKNEIKLPLRPGAFSLEASASYSTDGMNLGYLADISYWINRPKSRFALKRSRYEIGVTGGLWFGDEQIQQIGSTMTSVLTEYILGAGYVRYTQSTASGRLIGSLEGGVSYRLATVVSTGFSPGVFDDKKEAESLSGFGLMLGARGWYALSRALLVHVGIRIHTSDNIPVMAAGGVTLRF